MNNKRTLLPLALATFLVLGACVPDPLEVKGIPVVKPEIVVSTQIVPDQSLVVLLTKTFGALVASRDSDPIDVFNQITVNDAVVVIRSATSTDTLFALGNGLYGGVLIPFDSEKEYTLYVNSATMGEVTATTTVKPQVQFEQANAGLYFDGFDDTLAQVGYYFKDPPVKNWYMLNVLKVNVENVRDNVLNPGGFTRLLDDATFATPEYAEVFRVFPTEFKRGDTIAVYLSNINEDYYNFMKMRLDNRFSLLEYLSEPINYPSNVKGGKGFFNLYVPDIEFFVLE